ncbi:alpha/beta hydrolase [Bacillus timonensis]|uniref:Alpha/beta hydrolase n=1 Tax=Bacillus timonensis TaxID=1033734 RepID=A0A4V3V7A4_9BACI|nr:alpha/beta hydrolase [Bacillus timonensis]THE10613.1 alpha/beta hydrolase [Bacillus timonensis]
MLQVEKAKTNMSTIEKTLLTANMFDGFWDRWIVHGVDKEDLAIIRSTISTKDEWIQSWVSLAEQKIREANVFAENQQTQEAEMKYRTAGLYYQLVQWLIPEASREKVYWLNMSMKNFHEADRLYPRKTTYDMIHIGDEIYFGRVRVPSNPKGVVVIINPLDSTKEELFTYELDFLEKGFVTVSFDGPGQGQTYSYMGIMGTKKRWEKFIDLLIDYSALHFSNLPIYLFGTSSGAAWALYGSCNPKVSKVVAVSPVFPSSKITLPDYFMERTRYVLEESNALPTFDSLGFEKPVLLVHGKQDVMVSDEDIHHLYHQLPNGKCYLEYEDEGHCCNFKLPEVRQYATEWFSEI